MKNAIKEFVFKSGMIAGVEILARPDSSFSYTIQVLEKKGKRLVPVESFLHLTDKLLLFKTLKQLKCPVVINYQGKGIIHRSFQDSIKHNFGEALNRVVPSGNEQEFHIQLHTGGSGHSFVSILRKQLVDELLNEWKEQKIDVVGFLLGHYHLELIVPLTESKGSLVRIRVPGEELLFEDGHLREVKPVDAGTDPAESITVEGKEIAASLYPALAAAMYYFIPLGAIATNTSSIAFLAKEFAGKKAFVTLSRTLIAFLLLLTLGNFFIFNSWYKEQSQLAGELAVYESSLAGYEQLNAQLKNKEAFIEAAGLQNGSRVSYYTDRILYDMPAGIQLNYFSAFPTLRKTEKDSVIRFDPKKIQVKGVCLRSMVLNEWLKLLKTKDFVADAVLENYNQESDREAGKFDIAIQLK